MLLKINWTFVQLNLLEVLKRGLSKIFSDLFFEKQNTEVQSLHLSQMGKKLKLIINWWIGMKFKQRKNNLPVYDIVEKQS